MVESLGIIMADAQVDAEDALRRVNALLAKQPDNIQILFGRALVLAQLERLEDATQALAALVKSHPEFQPAWYNLGVLQHKQGDGAAALTAYQRSHALKPDDLPTLLNLGAVCLDAGMLTNGLKHFERACQVNSGSPKAHIGFATALGRIGRGPEGIAHLQTLLQQAPSLVDAWYQLGNLLVASGRLDQAEKAFARVIELEPANLSGAQELARVYLLQRRYADAQALYTDLASKYPTEGLVFAAWAAGCQAQGSQSEADKHIDRAIQLAPENARVLFQCAAVLSGRTDTADLRRAESLVEQALALAPAMPNALDCLALLLSKRQQWIRSIELSRKAVELAPQTPDYALTHAMALQGAGQLHEAVVALQAANVVHTGHSQLQRQLGLALLAEGRSEAALEQLDLCLEQSPLDQRAIAHRAVALQNLSCHQEADTYTGINDLITDQWLVVPEGFGSLEEFNRAFASDIQNHSRLRWEPIGLAARNGALTDELLADPTPAIMGFAASHRAAVDALIARLSNRKDHPFLRQIPTRYRLNYWATLVNEGGHIDTHIHEESWLSGAYYVELPKTMGTTLENPSGWIEFGRPHRGTPFSDNATLRLLQPFAGQLLMFPSYLFHRTMPFRGDGQRISVSFDLVPE